MTIKIVPILLASLVSGCSTVVRLPPNAITPVSADRRVDALASLSSCAVTPTTTAYGAKTSREAPRVRPGNWYQTGWSTVSLDHVPADVAEALRNCRLFVQGTTANARDADLVMDLGVQIGCATSGGATAFTFLMIVGTLDVYPFLGGAFPTAARAELVCQLAPADGTGPARIYRSQFDMKGWAPMYTVVRKENQLATQALQAALRDIVDQIANDQNDLNRIAHAVRLRRLPSQSIASTVPSPAPAGIARPPLAMKRTAPNGPVLQRWALVIGISKYQDPDVPRLQYASADARAFHDWLTSPQGGAYDPDHVTLLCDEQATSAAIRDALFNWLKQPIEEDLVTIYYAGHGSPESPDNLKNLFLLPYDVDYSKIGSTGFPMWDIETSLKRFIQAKRVIIIADACHAAGVGQQFDIARRAGRGMRVNPIGEGLSGLSSVGDSVCILSAAGLSQYSQEGERWGGGHGAFTYYLLQGLQGQADANRDGTVTVGELTPYVSEQVRRATASAQCPRLAGSFDPALTIGK